MLLTRAVEVFCVFHLPCDAFIYQLVFRHCRIVIELQAVLEMDDRRLGSMGPEDFRWHRAPTAVAEVY
jgi:hypothetical protein